MIRSVCSSILTICMSIYSINIYASTNTINNSDVNIYNEAIINKVSQVQIDENEEIEDNNGNANLLLYHPTDEIKREIPKDYPVINEMKINKDSIAELKMKLIENLIEKKYFSNSQIPELQKEFITAKDNSTLISLISEDKEIRTKDVHEIEDKNTWLGYFVLLIIFVLVIKELRTTLILLNLKKQ